MDSVMKVLHTHPKQVPVCSFLITTMVIIFLLYATTILKSIPCGNDILTKFQSQFVHTDLFHMVSNVVSLYALTRIELQLGMKPFILLMLFLLVSSSIMESIVHRLYPNIQCSIGFSGILAGMLTWEYVVSDKFDWYSFIASLILLLNPSKQDTSVLGHLIGAICGILCGMIWNKIK